MRNVQIKVTRTDTWWPVIEVPELMTDEEAEEWINAEAPDEVFDLESGGADPNITQENGDVSYTDEAQDCFNGIYSRVDSLLDLYTNLKG